MTEHQPIPLENNSTSDVGWEKANPGQGNTQKTFNSSNESNSQMTIVPGTSKSKKINKIKKSTTAQVAKNAEPEKPQQPEVKKALNQGETLSPEHKKLLQENENMKEQLICKICLDRDVNIVFLPCAHLVSCSTCAPALKKCPICHQVIKGTVNSSMS